MMRCTDSAEAILDSGVYLVAFDEKCNVCYTLSGLNKLSKMYAAISYDSDDNQVNFILLSVKNINTEV